VSPRRSAVPAAEREPAAWFAQPRVDAGPALAPAGAPWDAAPALASWAKADTYYYRNMARLQARTATLVAELPRARPSHPLTKRRGRAAQALWAANDGVFHRDVSAREGEAARFSVEHLLHLQRQQRATLRQAAFAAATLEAACSAARDLREGAAQPPSSTARVWLWRSKDAVDAACAVAEETALLLKTLLAVESAPQHRGALPAAVAAVTATAAALRAAQARLLQSCVSPQPHMPLTVQLTSPDAHPQLVTPSMLSDLSAALAVGPTHLAALRAAVPDADGLPGWAGLLASLEVLSTLVTEHSAAASRWSPPAAAPESAASPPSAGFVGDVDKLLADVLLWAQALHGAANPVPTMAEDAQLEAPEKINDWTRVLEVQLGSARLAGIGERFLALCRAVAALSDDGDPSASAAAKTLGALASPLAMISAAAARVAADYVELHKSTAKLCGTLAGVFSGLARDGFCAAPGEVETGDEGGGQLLDDQAGTGIGAGEGKKDVSDEIEDEAQVLGMEDLEKDEAAQAPGDDAGQGLEMQGDFEGETRELEHDAEEDEEQPPEAEGDQLDKEVCAPYILPRGCPGATLSFAGHAQHCVDENRFTNISLSAI
jgi:hypothetical protein